MKSKLLENNAPYISVVHRRCPLRVYLGTILYADAYRNAVYIHTDAGVFKTYMTFEKFCESLCDLRFLSCYKGCIVNMDRVSKIKDDDFIMDNGEKVQIRKRGGKKVKRDFLQYVLLKQLYSENKTQSINP